MKKEKHVLRRVLRMFALFLAVIGMCVQLGSVKTEAAEPTISKKTQTLKVGQQVTLQVKNANAKVKWSTSNKKVVKIGKTSGSNKSKVKIEAQKTGTATVTAKIGSKNLKVKVTVKSYTINKKMASVNEGNTVTLTAKNAGKNISWSSNNEGVAKIVNTSGSFGNKVTVMGVSSGTATITGKIGSAKVQTKVTVKHVHKYSAATCTTPATCSCGAVSGQALGHLAGKAATCTEAQYCERCHVVLANPMGHSMSKATCQQVATCQRPGCGYTEGGLADHDWNYDTGHCRTPGCDAINLQHFLSMRIVNCGYNTDLIALLVSNNGRYTLQICDEDGKATVYVPSASLQLQARAWDVNNGRAIAGYNVPSGSSGYAHFATTNTFGLDFDSRIEFDIFYNHVKYHVSVTEDGFTYKES